MEGEITHHKKFLERWAKIYLEKFRKEGPIAAKDWANNTFSEDLIRKLVPIIHNGGKMK